MQPAAEKDDDNDDHDTADENDADNDDDDDNGSNSSNSLVVLSTLVLNIQLRVIMMKVVVSHALCNNTCNLAIVTKVAGSRCSPQCESLHAGT